MKFDAQKGMFKMSKISETFKKYYITNVKDFRLAMLLAFPLLLLPIINLFPPILSGFSDAQHVSLRCGLLSFFWVFVEELAFRGFIPVAIKEYLNIDIIRSSIIASVLFALFHFTGILNGAEFSYAAVQSTLAFGAGFSFSALAYRCKSIFPGIAVHFLLNITADLSGTNTLPPAVWIAAAAFCVIYGIYLFRYGNKETRP